MAAITIDVPEDGKLDLSKEGISRLPEPLAKAIQEQFNEVWRKAADSKTKELAPHIADPVERERLRQLEDENKQFKLSEAEREKRYEDALKLRDQDYGKKLEDVQKQIHLRDQRLQKAIDAEILAAALKAGARDESLDELVKILRSDIALGDDLEPFVKGADGKPLRDDTQALVAIQAYVQQYIEAKPHHRKATLPGGGARGGASLSHLTGEARQAAERFEEAASTLAQNPRDDAAINAMFEAKRAKRRIGG